MRRIPLSKSSALAPWGEHTPSSWPSWRRGTLTPQRPPNKARKAPKLRHRGEIAGGSVDLQKDKQRGVVRGLLGDLRLFLQFECFLHLF